MMKENADAQQRYDKAREQRRNKYRGNGSGVRPGVTLDDFHAYMLMHNYIFAPTGDLWPASSVNARIPPIMEGGASPCWRQLGSTRISRSSK